MKVLAARPGFKSDSRSFAACHSPSLSPPFHTVLSTIKAEKPPKNKYLKILAVIPLTYQGLNSQHSTLVKLLLFILVVFAVDRCNISIGQLPNFINPIVCPGVTMFFLIQAWYNYLHNAKRLK